jgi:SMODS and SLOG-associating 2TM effector domain 1/Protein of unknown function (DUF4231)
MAGGDALATVTRDQKRWSLTAKKLKASIGEARWTILVLAVVGAILETVGAQVSQTQKDLAKVLGYGGAAALAIAAVIRLWRLGQERTQAWIMARSGSESLKREMYLFRTSAGPYAAGNPIDCLLSRREAILAKLQPFLKYREEPKDELKVLGPLDAAAYLQERIEGSEGQTQYFNTRASQYQQTQRVLSGAEFFLALTGALLSVTVTQTGKQEYGAWVAVITTISGALAAHVIAQRYEQLTISFRATADRLEGLVARWKARAGAGLAELVEPCEAVLLEESQGWIAGADHTTGPTHDDGSADGPAKPSGK